MTCDGETELDAYSVRTFCRRHDIKPSTLRMLWRRGLGPDVMVIGSRWWISREAAARWRREREVKAPDWD